MERRQEGKENNADGSFPSSHMISLFNSLDAVHRDFTTKFAFHTLGRDKEEHCTLDSILNTINDKIVQIIDAIADGSLGFDVAFTQISASVTYATLLLSNLDPQQIVNYHEFLFHFLIFGCCLGTKYTNLICSPSNNTLLKYFLTTSKSNWPSRITYTHCGSQRESIINHLTRCLSTDQYDGRDVAILIADYTAFEFEEFLYVITNWTSRSGLKVLPERCAITRIKHYWSHVGCRAGYYVFIIPILLLTYSLVFHKDTVDSDLRYFANQLLFRTIYWIDRSNHHNAIRSLFARYIRIQPWNDAMFFIECFEGYEDIYGKDGMLQVLGQCLDPHCAPSRRSYRTLNLFHRNIFSCFQIAKMDVNGIMEAICVKQTNVNITQSVGVLYNHFVRKYGKNNKTCMLLSYQLVLFLKLCMHQRDQGCNSSIDSLIKELGIDSHPFILTTAIRN
eukprot:394498_1